MIRLCPNCNTERPVTEIFCEGNQDGQNCGWDLSTVDITRPGEQPIQIIRRAADVLNPTCRNGHTGTPGDIICNICGGTFGGVIEAPENEVQPASDPQAEIPPPTESVINGWRVQDRLAPISPIGESFIALRDSDGLRGVLTLYAVGSEPDQNVYGLLAKLPRDHIPAVYDTGRWEDRAFEVTEEFPGGSLADISVDLADRDAFTSVVRELAQSVHVLTEAGVRHRDLKPSVVFIRSRDPLDLVVGGFGSARLSEFDLDIVSALETTRYMAPEAIIGGVAAASDWWSLGMILLEKITNGGCFEGINEQAFLIHVLTNGVPLPDNLDDRTSALLRGLLARDRRRRWQWKEVQAWAAGESVDAPEAASVKDTEGRSSISLAGKQHRSASAFALKAAEAVNWDEAKGLLRRGAISTWASEAGFEAGVTADLRQLQRVENLDDDLKLAVALKALNPSMPLIVRGNIVTPGWLLDHPDDGYSLITGQAPDLLRKIDPDDWISRLKDRAGKVRKRLKQLEIAVEEETLRIHLLSTSIARLAALWEEKRRIHPDTEHAGITTLIERRQTAEEDLIILLAASSSQFRSIVEVVEEARAEATAAKITTFFSEQASALLARPRREIYRMIDDRIQNFARCGIADVDEWADQFRLDRRMSIGRGLALLSIPQDVWKPLPKQGYVSTILDFFAKRISGGVLRGPLTRMSVGKSARIDLTELGAPRVTAGEILDHLLARVNRAVNIDPNAFSTDDSLERRLRSLHSHAQLYKRDTGIDGMYMGFPFLVMRDGRANALPRIAPVLLWPIRVSPEVGNRGHVALGFGRDKSGDADAEHVIVNPALEAMVGVTEAKRWHDAAQELLTHTSLSLQTVLDAFSRLATPVGFELVPLPAKDLKVGPQDRRLVPSAVLFHLAFMGQSVMKDLELLRGVPPTATALEAALRLSDTQPNASDFPQIKETDRYFTADSDPSQEAAVLEARQTPGLVIEGPPGTGKSQTIVNMVADAIGTGKSLLVICQKQAAIEVVRKRLERERLGDRFVMITDASRDRSAIIGGIRSQVQALHNRPQGNAPVWRRERERFAGRIEALEADLDRHQMALHSVDERTGMSYRELLSELMTIEESDPGPINVPALRPLLGGLHPADIAAIQESCGPLSKFWLPSKFEGNSLSALKAFNPDRGTAESFEERLRVFAKADAKREVTDAETSDCLKILSVESFRAWLDDASDLRSISTALFVNLARWLRLFRDPEGGISRGDAVLSDLSKLQEQFSSLDVRAYKAEYSTKLISVAEESLSNLTDLLSDFIKPAKGMRRLNPLRWLRRRRLNSILLSMQLPQDQEAIRASYHVAKLELSAREPRRRLDEYFTALFDRAPDLNISPEKLSTFAGSLHSILAAVERYVRIIDTCPSRSELDSAISTGKIDELERFFERGDLSLARQDAREASRAALHDLQSYFEESWLESRHSAIDAGRTNAPAIEQIIEAMPLLSSYQEFRIRSVRLGNKEREIFAKFRPKEADLEAFSSEDLDACVRSTIAREAYLEWKAAMEAATPDVMFDRDEIKAKVNSLAEADEKIRDLNRELLVHGVDPKQIRPSIEWEAISKLTGPNALRLRQYIERAIPMGLFALRPVWLMTPDVASRVLQPRSGLFDTVIFDEASQMPVEYALPCLFRSKIMIVSGDEKQMPPTSFFASKVENDEAAIYDGDEPEEGATEEEREAFAETWNRREIKDCPDLLQLARTVLRSRTLQVHYRSEYRELISFSNASFYGNSLSVPVRHPEEIIRKRKPIELIRSDGVYKNQTNQKEASDVVQYLAKTWSVQSPPSVGVVTFNRKQADAIEDALEKRAEVDALFRATLMRERERTEDGEDMSFFVRNVENVQGDERDVIVFSTTFGRNETGAFRRSFGALGHSGGERRLNVAVTRARRKVAIVTSMPISEISDLLTRRSGPRVPRDYLQGYLEYARTVSEGLPESGSSLLERLVTERRGEPIVHSHTDDGFARSVESFLQENGWQPAKARDGGAFSLDFAIRDPRTGLYAIGLECDAPRHRLLERARAREIWRPKVLGRAIPNVHRVSSYAWAHAGDTERQLLKTAVEKALGGVQ